MTIKTGMSSHMQTEAQAQSRHGMAEYELEHYPTRKRTLPESNFQADDKQAKRPGPQAARTDVDWSQSRIDAGGTLARPGTFEFEDTGGNVVRLSGRPAGGVQPVEASSTSVQVSVSGREVGTWGGFDEGTGEWSLTPARKSPAGSGYVPGSVIEALKKFLAAEGGLVATASARGSTTSTPDPTASADAADEKTTQAQKIWASIARQSVVMPAAGPAVNLGWPAGGSELPRPRPPPFSIGAAELVVDGESTDSLGPLRVQLEDVAFVDSLDAALPRPRGVIANPASQRGSHQYERFVDECHRHPELTASLIFHGTPAANIPSIGTCGLNPTKRGTNVGQVCDGLFLKRIRSMPTANAKAPCRSEGTSKCASQAPFRCSPAI